MERKEQSCHAITFQRSALMRGTMDMTAWLRYIARVCLAQVIGIIVTAFGIMVLIFIIVLNVRTRAPYSINKCDGSGDPAHPHTHHNTAAAAPRYSLRFVSQSLILIL